jgi:two-component system NtrC family sensor kinase
MAIKLRELETKLRELDRNNPESMEKVAVLIEIADTGVGIEPDRLEGLFDPGFSAEGPRVKAGLGLLVSLNIIRNHGGNIEVQSQVGEGTAITIVLPRPRMAA